MPDRIAVEVAGSITIVVGPAPANDVGAQGIVIDTGMDGIHAAGTASAPTTCRCPPRIAARTAVDDRVRAVTAAVRRAAALGA
jgi:hypothetical protein